MFEYKIGCFWRKGQIIKIIIWEIQSSPRMLDGSLDSLLIIYGNELVNYYISYFSHCCSENNLIKEGGCVLSVSTSWQRQHLIKPEMTSHIASAGRKQRETSAPFLFFIQSGTPDHGMLPATIRVGLPISVNPISIPSQTCPGRFWEMLESVLSVTLLDLFQLFTCTSDFYIKFP